MKYVHVEYSFFTKRRGLGRLTVSVPSPLKPDSSTRVSSGCLFLFEVKDLLLLPTSTSFCETSELLMTQINKTLEFRTFAVW